MHRIGGAHACQDPGKVSPGIETVSATPQLGFSLGFDQRIDRRSGRA